MILLLDLRVLWVDLVGLYLASVPRLSYTLYLVYLKLVATDLEFCSEPRHDGFFYRVGYLPFL